ncbi:MAG: hypothetical protein IT168_31785 [Bryobacterales bacterium]|nr:hypothetical protein [Bryobacterales bacterium]
MIAPTIKFRAVPVVASLLMAALLMAADPASLNGTWVLDVHKSNFGKVRKPASGVITIQHAEPKLRYTGTNTFANEKSDYGFDGSIDGKAYTATHASGPGTMTIKRLDSRTIESYYKADAGGYEESARTSISADGKVLTRKITVKAKDGTYSWTEIYNRK